jgi:hypothetical protein
MSMKVGVFVYTLVGTLFWVGTAAYVQAGDALSAVVGSSVGTVMAMMDLYCLASDDETTKVKTESENNANGEANG